MINDQRSIARLPLHIFTNLSSHEEVEHHQKSPEVLRNSILKKLENAGKILKKPFSNDASINTVGELMSLSHTTLLRLLDPLLISDECEAFIERICSFCAPEPITAKVLLSNSNDGHIPFDVHTLDDILKGGIRVGSITEFCGQAGVGKTQLALQLSVVAARLGYGSIFIDTEKKLSLQRLNEIARERYNAKASSHQQQFDDDFQYTDKIVNDVDTHTKCENYCLPSKVLANVIVHAPTTMDELLGVVSNLDEEIILQNEEAFEVDDDGGDTKMPIRLVILDSIAAPTRRDFGGGSAVKRVAAIYQIAKNLKRIAETLGIAILVINQIDKVQNVASDDIQDDEGDLDPVSVEAALGVSWYHCVTTRIGLEHDGVLRNHNLMGGNAIRKASILKSNSIASASTKYKITMKGIEDASLS